VYEIALPPAPIRFTLSVFESKVDEGPPETQYWANEYCGEKSIMPKIASI
jgi:hypothetical protein